MAIAKLKNEGLINNAHILYADDGIFNVIVDSVMISSKGIDYVEQKLQIDKTLSNKDKLEDLIDKSGKWGWEQLKEIASKTLAEVINKAAGVS